MHKGLIDFETGLRTYSLSSKDLVEKEKVWSSLPKLDRHGMMHNIEGKYKINSINFFIILLYFFSSEFPSFLPPLNEEKQIRKQMMSDRKAKLKLRSAL